MLTQETAASVSSWLMRFWQESRGGFHSTPQAAIESTGKPPEDEATQEVPRAEAMNETPSTPGNNVPDPYADLAIEELQELLAERDVSLSAGLLQAIFHGTLHAPNIAHCIQIRPHLLAASRC